MHARVQNKLPSKNKTSVRLADPRVVEGRGHCLVTRMRERELEKVQVRDHLSDIGAS